MEKLLLTIDEVSVALGIGRRLTYKLRVSAEFPQPITLAQRVVRYRAADVQQYVERLAERARASERLPEPENLTVARAAKRGSTGGSGGGMAGGSGSPAAAKPRRARPSAERGSVELENRTDAGVP
jgi:predicted DNA-binding transcriptional regulator AlpA